MEVAQLRVLDAVARTGSLTAAAAELHYAQASVSHHLGRLQESIGAPLTVRMGRGVVLTEEGQVLARRAHEILERLAAAQSELGAMTRRTAGRLRIAAFQSALISLVPAALSLVQRQRPGVELSLRESHPEEAMRLVREAGVDVAIVRRPFDRPPGDEFTAVALFDDSVHVLSADSPADLAFQREASWIVGCDDCKQDLENLCRTVGFEPRIGLRSEDILVQSSFVAAGLGVCTVPGTALRSLDLSGIHAVEVPGARTRVWVIAAGGEPTTGLVSDFIAVLTTTDRPGSDPT